MKYFGKIGFNTGTVEDPAGSGIWVEQIVEKQYYGDVIKNVKRAEEGVSINDDVDINNRISIVADPFANNHIFQMRYISWMGSLWKIKSVEVQYPRLILSIGGVWNGQST